MKKVIKKIKNSVMFVEVRSDESQDRARSFKKRAKENFHLGRNGLPVYAPIMDLTEKEVWEFLLSSEPPYGGSYQDVISIYKEARGECPLIPEKTFIKTGAA